MQLQDSFYRILARLCDTPTAPYREERVVTAIRQWHGHLRRSGFINWREDAAANVHLDYHMGRKTSRILVLEAHLDHPGYIVTGRGRDGTIRAIFRGGVKPSCFMDARVALWTGNTAAGEVPEPVVTTVRRVTPARKSQPLRVTLAACGIKIPRGTIGTWHLPAATEHNGLFMARACDDLAGVAAGLCVLERLLELKAKCNVTVLLTRAEEVGFAGAIAAAQQQLIPRNCALIGLEASRATTTAIQGAGPVIRVGDRTSTFSPALTRFMAMIAGGMVDESSDFHYQRALMDGGTCDSTVFHAFGYETGAVCLALGNYHNMFEAPTVGLPTNVPKAGPLIASETIALSDFAAAVELLTQICLRFPRYEPGMADLQKRFLNLHEREQRRLLYRE
ncbi:MAG: M20/M25/M40 family metallo-hydrolase [Phycisphaerae bacterium]